MVVMNLKFKGMTKEEKLLKEVCERCESYAVNFDCEDMDKCPAYKLYEIAKSKRKTSRKTESSWEDTSPRNSEVCSPVGPTGWI